MGTKQQPLAQPDPPCIIIIIIIIIIKACTSFTLTCNYGLSYYRKNAIFRFGRHRNYRLLKGWKEVKTT